MPATLLLRHRAWPTVLLAFAVATGCAAAPDGVVRATRCTPDDLEAVARAEIRAAVGGSPTPGVTAAVYVPTRLSRPVATAHGWADVDARRPMEPDARMLAGSVGKTFYAAAALRLVDVGLQDLDHPVAAYLPDADVPAADRVTVRMLLSHRSGYGEYDAEFMDDLVRDPVRRRTLADWLGPLRRAAPAPPGTFRYSDINFVVLAHVVEAAAGVSAAAFIDSLLLRPHGLRATAAADRRDIAGLVPGYAGDSSIFGRDRMLDDGRLVYNPQFESGGGGYVSTSSDLARWIALFGTATLFSPERRAEATAATHADPRGGGAYGLGIHIDPTPLGASFGHSGYIPGYVSWVRWYDDVQVAVAIQTNTSDPARLAWDGYEATDRIAARVADACRLR